MLTVSSFSIFTSHFYTGQRADVMPDNINFNWQKSHHFPLTESEHKKKKNKNNMAGQNDSREGTKT